MNINSFGSIEKYHSLNYIVDNLPSYDKNRRSYLIKFINEFNRTIKKVESVNDVKLRKYILTLICKDYMERTDLLFDKYTTNMVSYLKNFIKTKIRISLKLEENILKQNKIYNV